MTLALLLSRLTDTTELWVFSNVPSDVISFTDMMKKIASPPLRYVHKHTSKHKYKEQRQCRSWTAVIANLSGNRNYCSFSLSSLMLFKCKCSFYL